MIRTDPDAPVNNVKDDGVPSKYTGLTKREYFAVRAMQGILANEEEVANPPQQTAVSAVRHAEFLISELNARSYIPRG